MIKALVLVVSQLLAFSAFASPNYSLEDKRQLIQKSYQFAQDKSSSFQVFNELLNLLSLPTLEEGSQIYFGTLVTLKSFTCQETSTDTVLCQATSLYCIQQNEFPPAYNTLTITASSDLQTVTDVSWTSKNAPLSACE